MTDKGDDVNLPRATIAKIFKEALPEDLKISKETIDLLIECCQEFIQIISGEANEICMKDNRTKITPEHILTSLQTLGFESYIEQIREAYTKHKTDQSERPKAKKLEDSGLSQEELRRHQQELFAKARSALQNSQEAVVSQQSHPPTL